jgi:anti-anti-sigma regulatory factor
VRSRRSSAARAHTIALPVECTLADAETLKLRLAALLRSVKPVTVDVALVRRIDTASLQLLAAFAHERRASHLDFATTGGSSVFAQAARLLGLAELLDPAASACASRPSDPSARGVLPARGDA